MSRCAQENAGKAQEQALIHAVIVNYNGLQWNAPCLDSLLGQEGVRVHVIFVDNASSDGSLERVRAVYGGERLECLPLPRNALFAAGCNAGIERALAQEATLILLLNNDTVMEPGCLAALAAFLSERPDTGGVQPLLTRLNDASRVASAGCRLSRMGGAWDHANGAVAASLGLQASEVPGITAGACLWRSEVLQRTGLFDESFGMYFEDVDLSLRARKLGYALYLLPKARVRHKVSATTEKAPPGFCVRYCQANALRLILKHWPDKRLADACVRWLWTSLAAFFANLLGWNWDTARGIGHGLLHGLRLMPGGLWRRRRDMPDNELLTPWIDWDKTYPPRPEA